ncbi:GNAT family N-acetyltransferase [Jannaschia sp. W003]|uniref:GNAT family N-acetyltransferase n=1 Tax=Jannaschia sp. W003 TaxID=2867012 RepID=UPI0021A43DC5|nr:GNAT family N-acetyltransferase [Jannaschia sp. W003]UWQ22221.1 GNAT family N-acetyltransferase [Jannaschia sp. W003]
MLGPTDIRVTGPAATRAAALAACVPVLDTPRTRLRAPHLTDFGPLHEIMGGARGAYAGGPCKPAETWADFARATATWLLRGHGMWTVEERDTGRVAGFVMISVEPGDLEHELGFLFTEGGEGRGLAEEAAAAARHHAWSVLRLPSLVSYVAVGNDRAERLMHRMGSDRDGLMWDDTVTVWRHLPPEGHDPDHGEDVS